MYSQQEPSLSDSSFDEDATASVKQCHVSIKRMPKIDADLVKFQIFQKF